jgi:hypothetical protein
MSERLTRFLRRMAAPWRRDLLAVRVFWRGCVRNDWTEEEFEAALRQLLALGQEAGRG